MTETETASYTKGSVGRVSPDLGGVVGGHVHQSGAEVEERSPLLVTTGGPRERKYMPEFKTKTNSENEKRKTLNSGQTF